MNPKIQLDMRLSRLIEAYPKTRSVFAAHGLGKLVDEENLPVIGPFLTLETALRGHDIAPANFLKLLNDCRREETVLDAPSQLNADETDPTHFLALMTCGLKVPFARALASFINDLQYRNGEKVNYAVVSNLNHEHSYYPYVNHVKTVADLPDIIVSADFNAFFYHHFYQRFIQPGHFIDVMDQLPNRLFADAGIADPGHQYTILCVNPLIIVADLAKVGDRPLPRRWADLLDPIWQRDITLRGNENFFCHAVLLPFYKEHGSAGIAALARNVYDGRHPAQMVKAAGSGRSAALYVMPDFFAHKIADGKAIQRIWPEDGALASPVTLLVKKERAAALKPIADYLIGEELARVFVDALFPSPHPAAQNRLPDGAGLKWIGWDYIRANDLEAVNAAIDAVFLPIVRKSEGV
jgi:ABC-type Fe3+ transport system substrate-binding protein